MIEDILIELEGAVYTRTMNLENYSLFKLENPTVFISVTEYGITFSKNAAHSLGTPEYVHVYLNEEEKKMLVVPCEKDKDAFRFYKLTIDGKLTFVRWTNRNLINAVIGMIEKKETHTGVRVYGEYLKAENYLIFDLKKSCLIKEKSKRRNNTLK